MKSVSLIAVLASLSLQFVDAKVIDWVQKKAEAPILAQEIKDTAKSIAYRLSNKCQDLDIYLSELLREIPFSDNKNEEENPDAPTEQFVAAFEIVEKALGTRSRTDNDAATLILLKKCSESKFVRNEKFWKKNPFFGENNTPPATQQEAKEQAMIAKEQLFGHKYLERTHSLQEEERRLAGLVWLNNLNNGLINSLKEKIAEHVRGLRYACIEYARGLEHILLDNSLVLARWPIDWKEGDSSSIKETANMYFVKALEMTKQTKEKHELKDPKYALDLRHCATQFSYSSDERRDKFDL